MGSGSGDVVDDELRRRLRAGDTAVFTALFDEHIDKIYSYCGRLADSRNDAEDLASMVFLEAWRRKDAIRIVDGSPLPWLIVVAANVSRNYTRSRRRYRAFLRSLPERDDIPDVADQVVADVDAKRRGAYLRYSLSTLGPEEQQILTLCDLAGMPYKDAAAVLDVPVGTVKSRLSRARASLREAMGPEHTWNWQAKESLVRAQTQGGKTRGA